MADFTEHFTRREVEFSITATRLGIDNTIPDSQLEAWGVGCEYLETIRKFIGICPLKVTSGYRCQTLNSKIGGSSKTSQHTGVWRGLHCCAFDLVLTPGLGGNAGLFKSIAERVRSKRFDCDQLIWEYGTDLEPAWVHIGFVFGHPMRGQILRKRNGSTKYELYAALERK